MNWTKENAHHGEVDSLTQLWWYNYRRLHNVNHGSDQLLVWFFRHFPMVSYHGIVPPRLILWRRHRLYRFTIMILEPGLHVRIPTSQPHLIKQALHVRHVRAIFSFFFFFCIYFSSRISFRFLTFSVNIIWCKPSVDSAAILASRQ